MELFVSPTVNPSTAALHRVNGPGGATDGNDDMKRTIFTAIALAATFAAPAIAQSVQDINGDGKLDYAELSAFLGTDRALEVLGGDETALLDSAGYDGGTADIESRAEANATEDDPAYRRVDDVSEFADGTLVEQSQSDDD